MNSGQNLSQLSAMLAENVEFDALSPHLVERGVISERRKEEYTNSHQGNQEKFTLLMLELSEQDSDVKLRFLQSVKKCGANDTALELQSHFGVELTDSSPSVAKSNTVHPILAKFDDDGDCVADGCLPSKCFGNGDENEDPNNGTDEPEGRVFGPFRVKVGQKFFSPSNYNIYAMGSKPKGYALVIVNQDFNDEFYATRIGAVKDRENLIGLLEGLGYMVHHYFNKKSHEIRSIVRNFAQLADHRLVDSTVVAISSHGETNRVVGTDSEYIFLEDILDQFNNGNCPHLMGKPKLFILQACRGEKQDLGVARKLRNYADGGKVNGNQTKLLQPVQRSATWTDMVIAYSTIPEYIALRHEKYGSWFIQAISEVFSELACELPLSELFLKVTAKMDDYQTVAGEKQVPEIAHRGWKKDLYFNPGLYQP